MHEAFAVHMLNEEGKQKARRLAEAFSGLAELVLDIGIKGREQSLAITKLEEACFFAKKSMAINLSNQHFGESLEVRARRMFEAYNAQGPNPGKTFDGRDVPPWEQVGAQVQAKWVAAAEASLR